MSRIDKFAELETRQGFYRKIGFCPVIGPKDKEVVKTKLYQARRSTCIQISKCSDCIHLKDAKNTRKGLILMLEEDACPG